MASHVVILGAGELGHAIGGVLRQARDVDVELWDKDEHKNIHQKPLPELLSRADALFLCIPSWAMGDLHDMVVPHLRPNTVIASFSKGIEKTTLRPMDEFLGSLLSDSQPYALIVGPMLAEELEQHMLGVGVVASKDAHAVEVLEDIFRGTTLRLEQSSDVRGVALASVLKNIYAIGLGIAHALHLGGNFEGWFVQRAIHEMGEILHMLGGKRETALGPAGLGDLVATGFSSYSRNHQVGDELVKTGECCLQSEGYSSMPAVISLLSKDIARRFPLLWALERVIIEHHDAQTVFTQPTHDSEGE